MSYERVWRIELYENPRINGRKRYKAVIIGYDSPVTGYGPVGTEAYLNAEEKLIVRPGFMSDLKNGEDRRK